MAERLLGALHRVRRVSVEFLVELKLVVQREGELGQAVEISIATKTEA